MDQLKTLAETVYAVVDSYACASPNSKMYHLHDAEHGIDAVIVVPHKRANVPYVVVMTRLVRDQVIIEADRTDRPLDEALATSGIARHQITVARRDETISTA